MSRPLRSTHSSCRLRAHDTYATRFPAAESERKLSALAQWTFSNAGKGSPTSRRLLGSNRHARTASSRAKIRYPSAQTAFESDGKRGRVSFESSVPRRMVFFDMSAFAEK